tara:strand:- start:1034 stop:2152 length:1119 start_codon:yes stop_codon:yes gene_type:complete
MSVQTGVVKSIVLKDDVSNDTYRIEVYIGASSGVPQSAWPLDSNITKVPLLGETVLLFSGIGPERKSGGGHTRLYYQPISLQTNPNNNALPNSNVPIKSESGGVGGSVGAFAAASAGNPSVANKDDTKHDLGEGFTEDSTVSPLQPFIGDVLIEGRCGHSLRFGYTPQTSQTTKNPSWSTGGKDSDPITILSNGRGTSGDNNKFIIEDIDDDKSSIWLTSTQKVRIKTSQNQLGTGVESPAQYDGAGITLNSDRILLNAKSDYIILSADKSVNVATPNWAMDLDKLFSEIQNLVDNVIKLNENVEKAHEKIASVAGAGSKITIPLAPSGIGTPVNMGEFIATQLEANTNKIQSTQIKETIKQIQSKIKNMEQ